MKHFYLTLATVFALIPSLSKAQSNFLLIGDSTSKWLQQTTCIDGGFGCISETQTGFTLGGTTFITNNVDVYRYVHEEYWVHGQPWPLGSTNPICHENTSGDIDFSFALREDLGKVYYFNLLTGEEHMIYDFTVQVGDSVPDPVRYSYGDKYEVLSIDSVLVGNTYRKRWNIEGPGASIIEGVGSTFGLVNPIGWAMECEFELLCYSEGDSGLYPNVGPACETELVYLNVDEEVHASALIQYTENGVNIVMKNPQEVIDYYLYDNTGRMVKSGNLSNQISLSNADYNAGVYLIQFVTEGETHAQRILIR